MQQTFLNSRKEMRNLVDGQNVPIPHFGIVLRWNVFDDFSRHLEGKVRFEIEPYLRFEGMVGEQRTMFFLDPSGNALEFKSFRNIETELFKNS